LPSPATATTPVSPRRSPAALIIDSSGAGAGSSSGSRLSITRSRTSTEPAEQQNYHHRRVVSRSLPAAQWRDAQQHWECEKQQPGRHADRRWDQQDTADVVHRTRGSSSGSSSSSSSRGGGGGGGGGQAQA
ncbi:unnamed protein product, partial [Ectocarpus sp. 8 AP-2014]